jgi:sigma-B regulation protein RsbU (phosphoserine phosphatase)
MLPGQPRSPRRTNRPAPCGAGQQLAQRLWLPAAPQVLGYRWCLVYRPAFFATGDYHDFFLQPLAGPAAFVGHGRGCGPTACLLRAALRALLHTHSELLRDPGATLTAAGRLFAVLVPADLFMTGLYLVLHEHGRVSWAAAGQDPPLRVNGAGQAAPIDLSPVGLPLGIQPEQPYATVTWQLTPGERLLVFTDGLFARRRRAVDTFGRRRLQACGGRLTRLGLVEAVEALAERVTGHRGEVALEDDFTLLGIEHSATAAAARA